MSLTLTANQLAAIASNQNKTFWLFKLNTDLPLLLTNCYKDIDYNSETYLSDGFILEMPTFDIDFDLKVRRYSFKLSNVNTINTGYFFLFPPYYRKIEVWKFWLDANDAMIDSPIKIFNGYFANFSNTTDQSTGESIQELEAVSDFVDFERVNGRQMNQASQEAVFSGDTGLRHGELKYENLPWGRP